LPLKPPHGTSATGAREFGIAETNADQTCDVLVVGSGAGGLSTAIVAKKCGLDVIVVEKEPGLGGTTVCCGGVLWIPGNPHGRANAPDDTRDAAREYLGNETGNVCRDDVVKTFLDNVVAMVAFFERETSTFIGMIFNASNADLKHFFDATRAPISATYLAKRLASHLKHLAIHGRGVKVTSGNALAARLAKTVFDHAIPLTPMRRPLS
jgi:succinate dehydrogenase/fumarate reductase flavoprotein subunit